MAVIKLVLVLTILASLQLSSAHIKQHKIFIKTSGNCTNGTQESEDSDFPQDLFSLEARRQGAILLHLAGSFYCFVLIALVCNDYFLPSVDCICQDLHLSKDVAGATFMALATSAPELFVNIIGTFLTESDLGIGTVVGSDVFNTLGVAACGGLAAYKAIQLEVWPLARDCAIFMAVVALLGLILWDEKVEWYEALCLVLLYVLYCTFLFTQKKLHNAAKSILKSTKSFSSQLSVESVGNLSENQENMDCGTYSPYFHHGENIGYTDSRRNSSVSYRRHSHASRKLSRTGSKISRNQQQLEQIQTISAIVNGRLAPPLSDGDGLVMKSLDEAEEDKEEEYEGCVLCSPPEKWSSRITWILFYPLSLSLYLTIPDCRRVRALYPLTFIMCTVWIGLSSYFVSWMMTIIGQTFGISDSVMGLTLVAIGGSMPEASTSIINARKGIGSMSISNALGGNTLDILLSLGLPWLIKTQLPPSMDGGPVVIRSSGLVYNNAAQFACTAALFIVAACNKFKMDRKLGIFCLILYLTFIVFIVLMEVDVFHLKKNSPEQNNCS